MEDSAQQLSNTLSCRKTVARWAAGGVFALILFAIWAQAIGFPYQHEWADDLPLFPITYALIALNFPAAIVTVSLNIAVSDISEWLVIPLAVAANIGAYALIGAYQCMLTRNAQSRGRR